MATRSLNKVLLIGNVVRDPEVRYTPQNTAVTTFTVATNRSWTGADGSEQESVEFTRVVCWGKLAEIVGNLIKKGRKAFVEGRLQTRQWESKEGEKRQQTEVVADQVIVLDSPRAAGGEGGGDYSYPTDAGAPSSNPAPKKSSKNADLEVMDSVSDAEDIANDIPF